MRRLRVLVPAAVALVVVAVVAGAAWSFLGGARRLGSIVEWVLVRRSGLPITVGGAAWNGRRLFLRDVRLAPGPALPLDARAGALTIDAGVLALVAPAGRTLRLAATGASLTLPGPLAIDGGWRSSDPRAGWRAGRRACSCGPPRASSRSTSRSTSRAPGSRSD
jgi:hypothetical protein